MSPACCPIHLAVQYTMPPHCACPTVPCPPLLALHAATAMALGPALSSHPAWTALRGKVVPTTGERCGGLAAGLAALAAVRSNSPCMRSQSKAQAQARAQRYTALALLQER